MMAFNDMRGRHTVCPFPLFTSDNERVPPQEVAPLMPNALVEVHFQLRHYKYAQPKHTFSARLMQVKLLEKGKPSYMTISSSNAFVDGVLFSLLRSFCR